MKQVVLLMVCWSVVATSFAQKETFDVIRYAAPKGWKKDVTETTVSYTIIKGNTWCRINIVKSTISKGDIDPDFENEWQEMVVKNYKPVEAPQINEAKETGMSEGAGWKIKAGGAKFIFNNSDAIVFLVTATGFERCASIIATTNSGSYMKDIEELLASVDLTKPEMISTQTPAADNNKNSILGTWCISASDQSSVRVNNGVAGTIYRQYTFNANATYNCNIKTFDPLMNSILLGRESGTYRLNGNSLTISPQKSVLEEWSKKNNADKWGKLLKTQNISLEKMTYSFTKIYIPENNEWQLILKAGNPTKRDGPFNNYEKNAWIYLNTSPSHPKILLPN
jgi:hypothetical protein